MIPEFDLDKPAATPAPEKTPEQKALEDEMWSRYLPLAKREQLELLLLGRLKERKADLVAMLARLGESRTYEEGFYRFYHGSFKVYGVQQSTLAAVELLQSLMPGRKLNLVFEQIIRDGTGKKFEMEHNRNWEAHTRPMLEAFSHARFMVDMAVRHADVSVPPRPLPTGYAALLYLFDLR